MEWSWGEDYFHRISQSTANFPAHRFYGFISHSPFIAFHWKSSKIRVEFNLPYLKVIIDAATRCSSFHLKVRHIQSDLSACWNSYCPDTGPSWWITVGVTRTLEYAYNNMPSFITGLISNVAMWCEAMNVKLWHTILRQVVTTTDWKEAQEPLI